MRRAAALACLVAVVGACAPQQRPVANGNVFLIVMENHSLDEVVQGAFVASLLATEGVAHNYHAITHPSVPNYLALSSGQTWGVQDDSYHVLPREDLGDQLTRAGIRWRAYMEGLGDAGCLNSPEPYDPGHNPFAFYGGACPTEVVPFGTIAGDLAKGDTRFSWIGPDSCHDGHNCPMQVADQWLRDMVAQVTASAAWKPGSALFITWDEDDGSAGNHVLTLVVRPEHRHVVSQVAYDHYSLLATIEDMLGVPRLANAAPAQPMNDLLS